ncbi:MAG: DUF983 domain-containing protein [Magnetospiraceae bacterium]
MTPIPPRSVWFALLRGLFSRCPSCGQGWMFASFLKVKPHCESCGEALHHHRADDFPAYIVIALVGHMVVPLVALVVINFDLPYSLQMAIFLPLTIELVLLLLQPVKGAVVAVQWHLGMHGFEQSRKRRNLSRD